MRNLLSVLSVLSIVGGIPLSIWLQDHGDGYSSLVVILFALAVQVLLWVYRGHDLENFESRRDSLKLSLSIIAIPGIYVLYSVLVINKIELASVICGIFFALNLVYLYSIASKVGSQ